MRHLTLGLRFLLLLSLPVVGCARPGGNEARQTDKTEEDRPAAAQAEKPEKKTEAASIAQTNPPPQGAKAPERKPEPKSEPVEEKPQVDPTDLKALVQGNNEFAFDLYRRLSQKEKGNLIFSPYSIASALAMTSAGARGENARQMFQVLHCPLEPERAHPTFAALNWQMRNVGRTCDGQLSVVNSLWGRQGRPFQDDFLRLARAYYHAEVRNVDFAGQTEEARRAINRWVEEQTHDKIRELIKDLHPGTECVLVNALYFKGGWHRIFQPEQTREEPFHVTAAEHVPVRMMHRLGTYVYFEGDGVQGLEMPYQNGASMVVILPEKGDGLREVETKLTDAQLTRWLAKARHKEYVVTVSFPKFTMRSSFELRKELGEMGLPLVFSGRGAFSGVTGGSPFVISSVAHEGYIDVNEKGTEAAAATAVVIMPLSGGRGHVVPHVIFRADHPFLFLLRETTTGNIFFMGRIVRPKV